MNPSYGKLVNGAIIHAPTSLNTPSGVIMNPKRLSYLQAGWKFLDLQPPVDPPPEGKEYRISGYTETATDIRPIFKLVPVVSPPRTFSKYKLVGALMQAQVWPQVKARIESVPGAYDLYLAAEDISEDEQLLKDGIAEVKKLLGWTDEQVEAVLAASVRA